MLCYSLYNCFCSRSRLCGYWRQGESTAGHYRWRLGRVVRVGRASCCVFTTNYIFILPAGAIWRDDNSTNMTPKILANSRSRQVCHSNECWFCVSSCSICTNSKLFTHWPLKRYGHLWMHNPHQPLVQNYYARTTFFFSFVSLGLLALFWQNAKTCIRRHRQHERRQRIDHWMTGAAVDDERRWTIAMEKVRCY